MYRTICAALALVGLAARASVGYGPVDCCPPPCGCDMPVIVGCDPAVSSAAKAQPTPPTPAETKSTSPSELPEPQRASAAPISPMPLNTPAPGTPPAQSPAADTPAAAEAEAPTAAEPELAEPTAPGASRYSAPPEESSAPLDPSVFEEAPATDPEATTETTAPDAAAEQSAEPTEVAPADATPPEESTTPDYDELFPPSSATGVLSAPGGIASRDARVWSDADGNFLMAGRVIKVSAGGITLVTVDGAEQPLSYGAMSSADLEFLKGQVEARRAQLAVEGADKDLLATQQ